MRLRDRAIGVASGGWDPLMWRQCVAVAPLLVGVIALPVVAGEPETKAALEKKQPEALAEFQIEKGGRPIVVPVRIQEREYLFLLDTGASFSALDLSLKPLLDKPLQVGEVGTVAEPITVQLFSPPEAFLGKLDLREGGPVLCTDLEMFRRVAGRNIRGFLGMG